MTPDQLAAELLSIATRIDASAKPDRRRVASAIEALIQRVAGRSDVLNAISGAFRSIDPSLANYVKEAGGVYSVDIGTGWKLEVVEAGPGKLEVKLNGHKCKDLAEAAKAFTSKNAKFAKPHVAPVPGAKSVKSQEQTDAEMAIYGTNTPLTTNCDPTKGYTGDYSDCAGSGIFWIVFEEFGIHDWTPWTDVESVVQRAREIAAEHGGGEDRAEDEVRQNWEDFKDSAWPDEYRKLLEGKNPELLGKLPDGFDSAVDPTP